MREFESSLFLWWGMSAIIIVLVPVSLFGIIPEAESISSDGVLILGGILGLGITKILSHLLHHEHGREKVIVSFLVIGIGIFLWMVSEFDLLMFPVLFVTLISGLVGLKEGRHDKIISG